MLSGARNVMLSEARIVVLSGATEGSVVEALLCFQWTGPSTAVLRTSAQGDKSTVVLSAVRTVVLSEVHIVVLSGARTVVLSGATEGSVVEALLCFQWTGPSTAVLRTSAQGDKSIVVLSEVHIVVLSGARTVVLSGATEGSVVEALFCSR